MNKQPIKHEYKTCPRCGTGFECKAGNILQCQCYGIELSAAARQIVEQQYQDCLCRSCLEALNNTTAVNKVAE